MGSDEAEPGQPPVGRCRGWVEVPDHLFLLLPHHLLLPRPPPLHVRRSRAARVLDRRIAATGASRPSIRRSVKNGIC
jgi:hypothetical protein